MLAVTVLGPGKGRCWSSLTYGVLLISSLEASFGELGLASLETGLSRDDRKDKTTNAM